MVYPVSFSHLSLYLQAHYTSCFTHTQNANYCIRIFSISWLDLSPGLIKHTVFSPLGYTASAFSVKITASLVSSYATEREMAVIISKSEQLSQGYTLESGGALIPAQVCPYQCHTFLKHTDNASQSKTCPSSHLRQCFQSSRTLFRHLSSPSSLYPACFISSSPPAVRHTQDFPIVKYINKPTPQWSFPMTVFIYK